MIAAALFAWSIFLGNIYQRAAVSEREYIGRGFLPASPSWRRAYQLFALLFYAFAAWVIRR